MVGGVAANYIARWNGNSWSALGSGMDSVVLALAGSSSDVYAGGSFTTAGGEVSGYAARAIIGTPSFFIVTTNNSMRFSDGQFYFTLAGPAGSNVVISASTDLQTWTPLVTNTLTSGLLNFTDALATNFTQRFYRARLQP